MSDYPNSGILGKNNRRRPDSNDAEYSGNVEITCPHCQTDSAYWLDGWVKTSKKDGSKFFSLRLKSKQPVAHKPRQAESVGEQKQPPMQDSGIPF